MTCVRLRPLSKPTPKIVSMAKSGNVPVVTARPQPCYRRRARRVRPGRADYLPLEPRDGQLVEAADAKLAS